jgi:hypothetical protein
MDLSPGTVLERLLRVIEKTFPIPGRFRSSLPGDVAELSRLLTSARPDREGGYLGRPNLLSAYLRYFLPWNVFRLYRLFSLVSGLDKTLSEETLSGSSAGPFLGLTGGDAITDIGSGPLTLPVALWLFRPELRKLNLEFRCVDHTGSTLEAGRKLFAALEAAESGSSWKIRTIRDSVNAPVRGEKAALVTAVNVFNEMCRRDTPASAAEKAVKILERLCSDRGSILVMEPGVPKSGAFIAALRDCLLERGKKIAAPCTHEGSCPLPGIYGGQFRGKTGPGFPKPERFGVQDASGRGKAKWCHFAFDTAEAPAELHRLSAAAGIPKERAVFSFLLAGKAGPGDRGKIRVISDAFPVPGGWGRYGCGRRKTTGGYQAAGHGSDYEAGGRREKGLILIRGSKDEIERMAPGAVVEYEENGQAEFDAKTGALIANLRGLG